MNYISNIHLFYVTLAVKITIYFRVTLHSSNLYVCVNTKKKLTNISTIFFFFIEQPCNKLSYLLILSLNIHF